MQHLRDKILIEAKRNGLNIEQLSTKVGMTRNGFNKTFAEESLKVKTLEKISEVLGVHLAWFFTEESSGSVHQVVANGNGNKQLVNSQLHERDTELALCQEKVKGLERENELLREMNTLLKSKQ